MARAARVLSLATAREGLAEILGHWRGSTKLDPRQNSTRAVSALLALQKGDPGLMTELGVALSMFAGS